MTLSTRITGSDLNVATTRTTWNTVIVLYLITLINYVLDRFTSFDYELTLDNAIVPLVIAALMGFGYRLSHVLSQRLSWWGVVLFLINKNPGYADPPPSGLGEYPEPAPEDVGQINYDMIIVVAICILVVAAAHAFFLD